MRLYTEHRASILPLLSQHFPADADVPTIAGMLVRDFEAIDHTLTPILGPRGVAALFQRSVHQARASHSVLAAVLQSSSPTLDLAALGAAIARQADRAQAEAAAIALLQAFHDLLASLVGQALTARLLGPAWALPPPPPATPEPPP